MMHGAYVRLRPEDVPGLVERFSREELGAALKQYAKRYPLAAMSWITETSPPEFQDASKDDPLEADKMKKYLDWLEANDGTEWVMDN
jgi:hypothetical protein